MQDQIDGVVSPHEHDVLSGRGNFVNYHAGNEHFRALVRKHKVAYVACPKPQKGKFSKMIYDEIRSLNPPGRFLKQDPKTKLWCDIGEKKALDKTRQALREGAPEIMKEITGDDDNDGQQQQQLQQQEASTANRNIEASSKRSTTPDLTAAMPSPATSSQAPPALQAARSGSFRGGGGGCAGTSPLPQRTSSSSSYASQGMVGGSSLQRVNSNGPMVVGMENPVSMVRTGSVGMYPQHHGLNNNARGMPIQTSPQSMPSSNIPGVGMTRLDHQTSSGSVPPPMNRPEHQTSGDGMQVPGLNRQGSSDSRAGVLPIPLMEQQISGSFPHPAAVMQQSSMGMGHAALLQGRQQQEQLQRMRQQSNPMPSSGGMSMPGASLQGNMLMAGYQQNVNGVSKMPGPGMNGQHRQQQMPYVSSQGNFGDGMSSRPEMNGNPEQQDDQFDSEGVGPLRPLKIVGKIPKRSDLKREGSESSIQVDTIFSGTKADESPGGRGGGGDVGGATACENGGGAARNYGSSAHLSVMSLTMDDMSNSDHRSTRFDAGDSNRNPDALSARFNSSLRLGGTPVRIPRGVGNLRRTGSGDGVKDGNNESDGGRLPNTIMDMSVATLGDRLSEFGDISIAHMAESEANMSFSNVFDDTDRDLYVERR